MNVKSVFFSPTGNTRDVVRWIAAAISEGMNIGREPAETDFTLPQTREGVFIFDADDFVIFGMPTYAGRLPNKILPFVMTGFRGNGASAIAVVTYGNRSFDSSLAELKQEMEKNGFRVAGAAAVPCSHVFSGKIGTGKPNPEDLARLKSFSGMIINGISGTGKRADLSAAGNLDENIRPYYTPLREDGSPAKFLKAVPKTDSRRCNQCGLCASSCPMGSIDREDCTRTTGICIKCQACVLKCPEGARYFDDPDYLSHVRMLENHFQTEKEPEFFLF